MKVPTVKVTYKSGLGRQAIINERDFNKEVHVLVTEKASTKTDALKSAPAPKKLAKAEAKAAAAAEKAAVEDEDDKPYTQTELASMTSDQMRSLPIFERIAKPEALDSKQDVIDAILKVQG